MKPLGGYDTWRGWKVIVLAFDGEWAVVTDGSGAVRRMTLDHLRIVPNEDFPLGWVEWEPIEKEAVGMR